MGVISIGDLVKTVIDEQRFTIDQLETYFRGELYCAVKPLKKGRGAI